MESGGGTMRELVSDWEANSEDGRDNSSPAFYLSSPADEKSRRIRHIRLHLHNKASEGEGVGGVRRGRKRKRPWQLSSTPSNGGLTLFQLFCYFQMSSSHLPNLSIISPISRYCQHNRQARITDRSSEKKKKKIGTHHLSFLPSSSPPIPQRKAHWVEGDGRHYAYENVLKEVWFMYALDADSITGQWLKWDLSRNAGVTWSDAVSLPAIRAAWKVQAERREEGGKKGGLVTEGIEEIQEAYLQPGHTPTGRE